jgi:hypothetical protein
MLHGAAGTGAFVGESAIALGGSLVQVWLYTFLFSLGVLVAMAAYAGILGGIFTWSGRKSVALLSGRARSHWRRDVRDWRVFAARRGTSGFDVAVDGTLKPFRGRNIFLRAITSSS